MAIKPHHRGHEYVAARRAAVRRYYESPELYRYREIAAAVTDELIAQFGSDAVCSREDVKRDLQILRSL